MAAPDPGEALRQLIAGAGRPEGGPG
jgi:hypothetical protein